ncbi:4556_t:CDS:10, partial [Racocetra persica]
ERWDDWEEETQDSKCLFCKDLFNATDELFQHCKEKHGFDFQKLRSEQKLDFYQSIRLINYVRNQVLNNSELENTTSYAIPDVQLVINDDAYLKPVYEDDPLLYAFDSTDIDDDEEFDVNMHSEKLIDHDDQEALSASLNVTTPLEHELLKRLRIVEEKLFNTEVQLRKSENQFIEYRNMVKESFFDSYFDAESEKSVKSLQLTSNFENYDYYFNSYAKNDIHEEMLKDRIRTESYRDFIYENKDLFKDKVVLDVGCGTCILSMFAAKAGASKVFSVDKSAIIHRAKDIVEENKLNDVITLFSGRIEDVVLPVQKVDIIISEWMGYFLFFEGMLDSLIVARDRLLAPDGIIAPSHCRLLFAAIEDEELFNDTFNFWNDVYGFKMTAMKRPIYTSAIIDYVTQDALISDTVSIKEVPLHTIRKSQLNFTSPFTLNILRDGTVHGFLGYFDTWFTRDGHYIPLSQNVNDKIDGITSFTTGPQGGITHWRQTIFFLEHGIHVTKGTTIVGTIDCRKNIENYRDLDFEICYSIVKAGEDSKCGLSVVIRLTNDGTLYYVNLPSNNRSDFVKKMGNDIATSINCDASRITIPTYYQYSNENNNGDQIFMRVNIAQGDDRDASSLASELNKTIMYKNISTISNGTTFNYIDQSNGAWLIPNLWDKYNFILFGVFVGLVFSGTLCIVDEFGKMFRRQYAIVKFLTISVSTLIVADLVFDILFIVFHRKDEKWIMNVSHELRDNDLYKRWWKNNSYAVLAIMLLSCLDNEALNVASSYFAGYRSLNALYTRRAYQKIIYAIAFNMFIEDVPQFIYLKRQNYNLKFTGEYRCDKKGQLMTWKIDKNCHRLSVYKNNYKEPISCNDFVEIGNYLGSYLMPNDDLIVIATEFIAIFTLIENEIQTIYYARITLFENIIQRHIKFDKKNKVIVILEGTFTPENLWDVRYFKYLLDFIDEKDTSSLAAWEYYNNITLVLLWITFLFFMVIYLLNLFIGLLNIAIQDNNSRVLFLLQKAEVLAEIELFYLLPHQRRWKS